MGPAAQALPAGQQQPDLVWRPLPATDVRRFHAAPAQARADQVKAHAAQDSQALLFNQLRQRAAPAAWRWPVCQNAVRDACWWE
jgi:hypothetical protein